MGVWRSVCDGRADRRRPREPAACSAGRGRRPPGGCLPSRSRRTSSARARDLPVVGGRWALHGDRGAREGRRGGSGRSWKSSARMAARRGQRDWVRVGADRPRALVERGAEHGVARSRYTTASKPTSSARSAGTT